MNPNDPQSRNPLALSVGEREQKQRRIALLRSITGVVATFACIFLGAWLIAEQKFYWAAGVGVIAAALVGGAHEVWRSYFPPPVAETYLVKLQHDDDPVEWDAWLVITTVLVLAPIALILLVLQNWPTVFALALMWWLADGSVLASAIALAGSIASTALWELVGIVPLARRWGLDVEEI